MVDARNFFFKNAETDMEKEGGTAYAECDLC